MKKAAVFMAVVLVVPCFARPKPRQESPLPPVESHGEKISKYGCDIMLLAGAPRATSRWALTVWAEYGSHNRTVLGDIPRKVQQRSWRARDRKPGTTRMEGRTRWPDRGFFRLSRCQQGMCRLGRQSSLGNRAKGQRAVRTYAAALDAPPAVHFSNFAPYLTGASKSPNVSRHREILRMQPFQA